MWVGPPLLGSISLHRGALTGDGGTDKFNLVCDPVGEDAGPVLLVCVVSRREWATNAGVHDDEVLVAGNVEFA